MVKDPPANAGDIRDAVDPWVGEIPWRRAQQPAAIFLPGESPWTEEPGGLPSMGVAQSRTRLRRLHVHACAVISEHWAVLSESQDTYAALPSSGLASPQKLESPAPSKPGHESLGAASHSAKGWGRSTQAPSTRQLLSLGENAAES